MLFAEVSKAGRALLLKDILILSLYYRSLSSEKVSKTGRALLLKDILILSLYYRSLLSEKDAVSASIR